MKMSSVSRIAAMMAVVASCLMASGAHAQLINNGSFESNGGVGTSTFDFWTSTKQGDGYIVVQTGTTYPDGAPGAPAPPAGTYAAMSSDTAAGVHLLYTKFVVPDPVATATVSWEQFIKNTTANNPFLAPAGLSVGDTAIVRVDLMNAAADAFSIAPGDIYQTLFITQAGDPGLQPYAVKTADITSVLQAHPGDTLMLRFAAGDNSDGFYYGVDNVDLQFTAPEPGAMSLIAAPTFALGLAAIRRRIRRAPRK